MFGLLHYTLVVGTAIQPVDVNTALLLALVSGVAPLFMGLGNSWLSHRFRDPAKTFIASAALGIAVLSVWDLFQGASGLGLAFGPGSISTQAFLLLATGLGFVIPLIIGRSKFGGNMQNHLTLYSIAYAFAVIVGFHAFAEGIVIGFDLQVGYTFTFTQRTVQALSFVLHKVAEGIVISIPMMLIRPRSDAFVLAGMIGSVPLLIGIALAYMGVSGSLASYGFALGVGGSVYILLRLGYLIYRTSRSVIMIIAGVIVGSLFMYIAGWIHALQI